jgi:hypothetical protein
VSKKDEENMKNTLRLAKEKHGATTDFEENSLHSSKHMPTLKVISTQ